MQKNWYLRTNKQSEGPFSEPEIRARLLADAFRLGDEVKQGDSDWRPAAYVKEAFLQVYRTGWYVKIKGKVAGPFVTEKILELERAGLLRHSTSLRQGFSNGWQEAKAVITMLEQKASLLAQIAEASKACQPIDAGSPLDNLDHFDNHDHDQPSCR